MIRWVETASGAHRFEHESFSIQVWKGPHWGEYCLWIHLRSMCLTANKPLGTNDLEKAKKRGIEIAKKEVNNLFNFVSEICDVLNEE